MRQLNLSKQNNPDILIAKLDLEMSEKDISIAESDLKPTASVSLEKSYTDDLKLDHWMREIKTY